VDGGVMGDQESSCPLTKFMMGSLWRVVDLKTLNPLQCLRPFIGLKPGGLKECEKRMEERPR